MLCEPRKYLLLPALAFAAAFGLTGMMGLSVMMTVYWACNIYHFGMQKFGVLRLCWTRWPRLPSMLLCLGATACGMTIPSHVSQSLVWLAYGVFSFNHWIMDIGLSSRASHCGWPFVLGVLGLGAVGWVWMVPTSAGMMMRVIPPIICARAGLGVVHFLYSGWVWRLNDPRVRATIGRGLLMRREQRHVSR